MDLQPLGDRLIVEVLEEEERRSAGSSCRTRPRRSRSAASVLAVGPGSLASDRAS